MRVTTAATGFLAIILATLIHHCEGKVSNVGTRISFPESEEELYQPYSREGLDFIRSLPWSVNVTLDVYLSPQSTLTINLRKTPHLLTKTFHHARTQPDSSVFKEDLSSDHAQCFYQGRVASEPASLVTLNLCEGIEGVIHRGDQLLHLTSFTDSNRLFSVELQETKRSRVEAAGSCNFSPAPVRRARAVHAPADASISTRYIELYLVLNNALYLRAGSDEKAAISRAIHMVNYASSLLSQLDIYLVLVGVEVWTDGDKFTTTGDVDAILQEFETYRQGVINVQTANDNAQLLTARRFNDDQLGRARQAQICSYKGSLGAVADNYVDDYINAATTLAHEIGHNLGLSHDDEPGKDCTCPDSENSVCIMYSTTGGVHATQWSQCAQDTIKQEFELFDIDYCLHNLPEEAEYLPGPNTTCGNHFLDSGEQCDCGPAEFCDNPCCDAITCTLTAGAQCATGGCCDLSTCQLSKGATVCREVQDESCDLTEYCTGESEWCPTDSYKTDGAQCSESAYCYGGRCRSTQSQCNYLWGDEAQNSPEECYTKWNPRGAYYGHCGYTLSHDGAKTNLDYQLCAAEDSICGLLQCNTQADEPRLNIPVHSKYATNVRQDGTRIPCQMINFDTGGDSKGDPGMVPNGARCGDGMMCVHHNCTKITEAPKHCTCSQRGTCNNHLNCHCDDGWDPRSDCEKPGAGGSIDSGPVSLIAPTSTPAPTPATTPKPKPSPTILIVLLVVFLGVVPLAMVAIVLLVKRKKIQEFCARRSKTSTNCEPSEVPLNDRSNGVMET